MKIGNHSIPSLRLFPRISKDINLIYENYRLEEAEDTTVLAKLLGHKSANSGAFYSKLADMRLYGLLDPRKVKATPLAEKFTYGTEQEKQETTNKIILNVQLWKELHSRFGVKLPESNFWVQLQRITGLDPLEAQKHADSVRKAYLDDISHIKLEKEGKKVSEIEGGGKIDKSISISPLINARADIVKGLIMQGAYDIAKQFIDFIETKVKTEKIPKEEE